MTLTNDNSSIIADVTLDFTFDENLLVIAKHDEVQVKEKKYVLGNIYGGNSMSFTILFDPLECFKGTDIKCQITYYDHKGKMSSLFMEQKEIGVVCPVIKTDQDINTCRLKELIEELSSKDSRVYEVHSHFDVINLTSLIGEVVEKLNIRLVKTLYDRNVTTCEMWYYAKTKNTMQDIIIKVSILPKIQTLELFAATPCANSLAGILAEVGSKLKRIIEERLNIKLLNIYSIDFAKHYTNLLDMHDSDSTCSVNVVIDDSIIQNAHNFNSNEETSLHMGLELYDEWGKKGNEFLENKHYEEAIECFEKSLNLDKDNIFVLANKGIALYHAHRHEEALEIFRKALYASEGCNKGLSLENYEYYNEFNECFDRAHEIVGYNIIEQNHQRDIYRQEYKEWDKKGTEFLEKRNYEKAIECFENAFNWYSKYCSNLTDFSFWNQKGVVFYKLGRYEESIECYNKGLDIDPNSGVMWQNKGWALYKLGIYGGSIKCFKKSVEIAPDNTDMWHNMGSIFEEVEKYKEAIECYDKILDLNTNNALVWKKKGDALDKLCRYEEAIDCYDEALYLNLHNDVVWNQKGVVFYKLGRYKEAIECFNKSLDLKSSEAVVWNNKGDASDKLCRYEEAIECYEKALDLSPISDVLRNNSDILWNKKGCALDKLGRCRESIKCLMKSLEIVPDNADVWYNMGTIYEKVGLHREASDCYEKALELKPDVYKSP